MSVEVHVAPQHDASRDYGSKVVAVEPGGVEPIPLDERHGKPLQLAWTWSSPNFEFATVGVGILGVLFWGLTFWQCVAAIVIGTGLGAASQGVLSTWGPKSGLCQMVLSRTGFGFLGNVLPSGINALAASIGWFAVNSVSGALALHALFTSLPKGVCLLFVVVAQVLLAFFGHNMVQTFERFAFPVLAFIFIVGAIIVLSKAHPGMAAMKDFAPPTSGGFLLMVGASFGYAAGWNPYASDYTRYLPPESNPRHIGWSAGLGMFGSCVLLQVAGAAMVTAGGQAIDPGLYTGLMPDWLGKLTLLGICIGAVCANALNMYSASISLMAMGIRLPSHSARAIVALGLGLIGTIVAFSVLDRPDKYENFLLIIAYWIGPWLGVVYVDRLLRRGTDISAAVTRHSVNWAGPIAMLFAMAISIWLFSNQVKYIGPIAKHNPGLGDITFEVGFVLSAISYYLLFNVMKPSTTASAAATTDATADV